MSNELLSVENLKVEYPSFTLGKISFHLNSGEIVGLIGENGAGKSTTIKAIMGIVPHCFGAVYYDGRKIEPDNIVDLRQKTGYVGDAELYYVKMKVKQILGFLADLYDDWDNDLMEKYLDEFNIDPEKKMFELSMGMRVKLEILMALSHNAEIYLLDEPTSGLDPIVRSQVLKILKHLGKEEGKAILFSSHITSDIDKIADRVIYLSEGEILLDQNKEDMDKDYLKIDKTVQMTIAEVEENGGIIVDDGIVFKRCDLDEDFESEISSHSRSLTTEDVLFSLNRGIER